MGIYAKRRTASRISSKRRTVRRRPSRRRTSRRKPTRGRTAKGLKRWFRKKLLNQWSPGEYVKNRKYYARSHSNEMRDVDRLEAAARDNKAMNVFRLVDGSREGRRHWTDRR